MLRVDSPEVWAVATEAPETQAAAAGALRCKFEIGGTWTEACGRLPPPAGLHLLEAKRGCSSLQCKAMGSSVMILKAAFRV